MLWRWVAGAALAAATSGGVFAAEPAVRQPTSKWVMDFGETRCIAMRDYGTPDKPLGLTIKASPLGGLIQISVLSKPGRYFDARENPVSIQVNDHRPLDTKLLAYFARGVKLRSARMNIPAEQIPSLRSATTLSIQSDGEVEEVSALTSMPQLMAMMDDCVVKLQAYWSIGDARQAALKTKAGQQKPLNTYIYSDDYPSDALRVGDGGIVDFVMLIDEKGALADCMVTATSNVPMLDGQSCAILEARARFTPAIGADGKPARDFMTARIRWVMPKK